MVSARTILVVAICAVCTACAEVGPDYRVPAQALVNDPAANSRFVGGASAASGDPMPDHWWHLFDDPVLDRLVEAALASNTDLRAAQARLERSDALLAAARTNREPDVAFNGSTSYTQQSAESVLSHVEPPRHEIYDAGISISYDLDLFGGIRRGIEAASADHEAVIAARDLVRVNVAAETVRAYSDICNAGDQIDLLQQQISVQQERLALTRELIGHGRAPSFTQDREQSAVDSSRAQLAPLEARRLNAAFRLATLMGLPPSRYDPTLLACHTPLELKTLLPTGDGQALLRRRPDVRAAERELAAATAEIGVQTAALYPDIKLGASLGSTGAAASAFDPLTNRFAVGPMVSWNLHRSAIRDRIAAARAETRASLAHFDGTVLAALRETETSLDTYAAALERLQRLEAARDAAQTVDERTMQLWKGGKVSGLEAFDAQRTRLAAESAVAVAESDVNNDQISTFLALGGGWQWAVTRLCRSSGPGVIPEPDSRSHLSVFEKFIEYGQTDIIRNPVPAVRSKRSMQRNPLLRNIIYLLAVDEHRNFTRAAEALCVSQSALSQKVRQLEDELGAQLFDRSGRIVRLTDFGGVYLAYARRAYNDLLTAQRAMQDVHDLSRGQLRVAFTPTFTEYLVAPVIEHFHLKYPGIVIEMTEMSLDAVENALLEDQVDLAFGFLDVRSDDIEAEPLFPEQLMLVVGKKHPLAQQSVPVTPSQFARIPLALLTRSFVSRFYVDSYFEACEMQPNIALQANSISAVLKIVSRGTISTILPSTIEFEHRNLQYVPLDPPFPVRTVALLRCRRSYRSVASTAFAATVLELLRNGCLSSLRTLKGSAEHPVAPRKRSKR